MKAKTFLVRHHSEEGACEWCGWPYFVGDYAYENDLKIYCSRNCARAHEERRVGQGIKTEPVDWRYFNPKGEPWGNEAYWRCHSCEKTFPPKEFEPNPQHYCKACLEKKGGG